MCLFLQGATGNINPLLMGWDWTHLARLGLPLGAEAVRIYWNAEPGTEPLEGLGAQLGRSTTHHAEPEGQAGRDQQLPPADPALGPVDRAVQGVGGAVMFAVSLALSAA